MIIKNLLIFLTNFYFWYIKEIIKLMLILELMSEQREKEAKYLYETESLKKDETDITQVLLDIQNHIKDKDPFEYDRSILEKKNFIITPNSIERIRKISYYISRGVPVLLEGPSGTSKTFST